MAIPVNTAIEHYFIKLENIKLIIVLDCICLL